MTIRVDSLRRGFLLFLLAAGLVLPSMATVAQAAEVTVFAAASLKNALDDAAKAYEAKTGAKVVTSYAASSALAKQIESGANADIFFSADLDWMDYLQQKNLIELSVSKDAAWQHACAGSAKRLDRIASDRKEFSSAPSSRSRWQACHGGRELGASREVRQSGFDLSWSVERCSAPSGASRKCTCRVSIRSQRRSAAWYRLWNGRKGRTGRACGWHFPRRKPSQDRVSGGTVSQRQAGGAQFPRFPGIAGSCSQI